MAQKRWNEEGAEGTDADQCMSPCSFWSLGWMLPASSHSVATAALSSNRATRAAAVCVGPDKTMSEREMCPTWPLVWDVQRSARICDIFRGKKERE